MRKMSADRRNAETKKSSRRETLPAGTHTAHEQSAGNMMTCFCERARARSSTFPCVACDLAGKGKKCPRCMLPVLWNLKTPHIDKGARDRHMPDWMVCRRALLSRVTVGDVECWYLLLYTAIAMVVQFELSR